MQNQSEREFVTVMIGDQLFGLPIDRVHDVSKVDRWTRVPLAQPEIAGMLNLRGRIVTAIDMRRRLDFLPVEEGKSRMMIGVEYRGESYGLLVDQVGDVLKVAIEQCDPIPANLDPHWVSIAAGIYRLKDNLMVVLDVDRVIEIQSRGLAA